MIVHVLVSVIKHLYQSMNTKRLTQPNETSLTIIPPPILFLLCSSSLSTFVEHQYLQIEKMC